jgi:hypothetical protein
MNGPHLSGRLSLEDFITSGSLTQGCFLRVHMCLVGRSQDVSSSVPPRTRITPSLGVRQIHEPHSGQTSLMLTRPLSAVR